MGDLVRKIRSENNDFQHVLVLRDNRKARQKYREFYVEGVRSIESMLAHRWDITAFYYDADRRLSGWAQKILDESRAPVHFALSSPLMQKLSEKTETSELVATARIPDNDFTRIPVHDGMLVVVLDRPANPGNLGTSIRSCDAFGVDAVVTTGHAADPYHPQAVRGSMGSLFAVPVLHSEGHAQLAGWIAQASRQCSALQVVGTSARGAIDVRSADVAPATILCIGNETDGLAPRIREMCGAMLTIPMQGWASSLNVSCALSILLYEFQARREVSR